MFNMWLLLQGQMLRLDKSERISEKEEFPGKEEQSARRIYYMTSPYV